MKYIDAHTHVYSDDDLRYPSVQNPVRPPGDSGTISSLKKLAEANNISKVCVLQPSSFYGWDNRFVCELGLTDPEFIATICTLNPDDAATPSLLAELKSRYQIRGIRSVPASDGNIDHPGVRALWKACCEHDLTIDLLTRYGNAPQVAKLVAEFPDARCVIDHCLFLASDPDKDRTMAAMLDLARYPNVFAKLSFVPLGKTGVYPYSDLHEPCLKLIEAYGSERCLWGSNFPAELWTPNSSYRQNLELFTVDLGLSAAVLRDILWNTPLDLWFEGEEESGSDCYASNNRLDVV